MQIGDNKPGDSNYVNKLEQACAKLVRRADIENTCKIVKCLIELEKSPITHGEFNTEKTFLKEQFINLINLHPLATLIMNTTADDRIDQLGRDYTRSELTAMCILYKIGELRRIKTSKSLAEFEGKAAELGKLEVALALFKALDAGEIRRDESLHGIFDIRSSETGKRNIQIRNKDLNEAKKIAWDHHKALYGQDSGNDRSAAKEIFWNKLERQHRATFPKFLSIEGAWKKHTQDKSKERLGLRDYVDKFEGSSFGPYKTLARYFKTQRSAYA